MDQFTVRRTLGDLEDYLRLLKRYERFYKYQQKRLNEKALLMTKPDMERLGFLNKALDELDQELSVYDQRKEAPRHWR